MSIFLDEIKPYTIYHGLYYYPINKMDKRKNAIVYLLTPNQESTIRILQENSRLNSVYFKSYYTEKSVNLIINRLMRENCVFINDEQYFADTTLTEEVRLYDEKVIDENVISYLDETKTLFKYYFGDYVDTLLENSNEDSILRFLLYKERMKNQSDILKYYDHIKKVLPFIEYTYSDPKLYKEKNLIYDWSFYTEIFIRNNTKYFGKKGIDLFYKFIERFTEDKRFNNYIEKTLIIPVNDWVKDVNSIIDFQGVPTAINMFLYSLKYNLDKIINTYKKFNIVFVSNDTKFFRVDFKNYDKSTDYNKIISLIRKLNNTAVLTDDEFVNAEKDSKTVILHQVLQRLEKSNIKLNNLTGDTKYLSKGNLEKMGLIKDPIHSDDIEVKKASLVEKLKDSVEKSENADEVIENLDKGPEEDKEWLAQVLLDIQQDEGVKMDKVRLARHTKTKEELLKKTIGDQSIKQLLDQFQTNNSIPESSIPIDSIDDHWKHVKFTNFNQMYTEEDMKADIVAMFTHFTNVSHPMNIININVENTSTSEDYKDTWTVNYEDAETGKRYTMKLDMPRMIDNRFMKLRGNEKVLIGQLMLLPIEKTDEDTVQIVSNYNKIFVRRKSPAGNAKSTSIVNKMSKILNKYNGKEFKVSFGDNRKICSKYQLPVSFIDLAIQFNNIKFPDGSYIDFNMDNLKSIPIDRSKLDGNDKKLDETVLNNKYMSVYVNKGMRQPIIDNTPIDVYLNEILKEKSPEYAKEFENTSVSRRLMYSEASVLASKIPVIVVCAYSIGLQKTLDKAKIKYEFSEKRPNKEQSYVKFLDGYLIYYPKDDADNMFMNGLTQVETQEYSIREINSKDMWLNVLDDFGGRIKADGLDNFYDLMMDPITVEICKTLNLPYDYIDALIYSSGLLVDNKFNRHSDISGNRLRINEVIVGHLYQILSKEFGRYRNMVKRNKGQASFTAKQSAVIDSVLNHDQTSSDYSTLTPLLEAESANKVTFKGLSGMNSERAFSMEKRTYDDSMLGVVSLSTGFANTVGINRQTTIDAGIVNKRGFIVSKKPKDLDNLSTLSVMEALSPMAINHDDGMRTCMAFTQTVQHQMSVRKAMPNLITTGMDEALIYITGDKFAYKFKGNKGKVIEMTEDYIVVEDSETKKKDYIDIREKIQKNSDGGFFLTTKLTPNKGIKVGTILKKDDIVAYNKKNYSPAIGNGNQKDVNSLSYNIGTLAKVAIMNTDMGFEDSCVVDEFVSEALSTELCVQKEIALASTANIYYMVNKGEPIEEGEPLIIFTDSFEDEDANAILRSIAKDNEGELSDIGRKNIHSKVSGIVQDIKIYRTVDISKLSPTLKKIVNKYESDINRMKKVMEKYKIDRQYELESTDKLPQEGKLKNVEGILIEFYVKTIDKYSSGDKLVYYNGLKGVCSDVISKEDHAFSEYRPNESVNAFLTCSGVGARMVPSALSTGLLNKALIELTRQCQEKLGIKWRPLHEIMTSDYND